MKHALPMRIRAILAAVVFAAVFSGCADNAATSSDKSQATSEITTEATTTTTTAATTTTTTTATTTAEPTDDTSAAPETTENEPEEQPINIPETTTPSEAEDTKPLAGDIKNSDGTYTQDFSTGHYTIPECVADTIRDNFAETTTRKSNPSQIPYSEITLENAHLAFPFTGWIGTSQAVTENAGVKETGPDMAPDYIEILESDSTEVKLNKLRANVIGTSNDTYYYNQYTDVGDATVVFQRPTHFFASEADYKEFLAEWQRQADDFDRRSEQARLENESGNIDILGDLTEEDVQDLNDLVNDLLGS